MFNHNKHKHLKPLLTVLGISIIILGISVSASDNFQGALKTTRSTTTTSVKSTSSTGSPTTVSLAYASNYSLSSAPIVGGGGISVETCWDGAPATTDQTIALYTEIKQDGTLIYDSFLTDFLYSSSACHIGPIGTIGGHSILAQGETFTIDVTLINSMTRASIMSDGTATDAEIAAAVAASTKKMSGSFTVPIEVSIDASSISPDYDTFTAVLCDEPSTSAYRTKTVNFTANGHTTSTDVYMPNDGSSCVDATVNIADFGISLTPYTEYQVDVEVDNTIQTTFALPILPDIEITEAGLDGTTLYAEVCGTATPNDAAIGNIRFSIDDTSKFSDKYIGITVPTHNTCETFTTELTNAEAGALENGDMIQSYAFNVMDPRSEANDLNNQYYFSIEE